jgi:hypothetical protein
MYLAICHHHSSQMPTNIIAQLFRLIKDIRKMAPSTVLAIVHGSHKDPGATLPGISTLHT